MDGFSALDNVTVVAATNHESNVDEALRLADRIVVMADGRTVGELDGATATEEGVLQLATRGDLSEAA